VQAFALTGLVDFAEQDSTLRSHIALIIRRAAGSSAPSMRARGKKLLKRLGRQPDTSSTQSNCSRLATRKPRTRRL
jgi:hypothetical protein